MSIFFLEKKIPVSGIITSKYGNWNVALNFFNKMVLLTIRKIKIYLVWIKNWKLCNLNLVFCEFIVNLCLNFMVLVPNFTILMLYTCNNYFPQGKFEDKNWFAIFFSTSEKIRISIIRVTILVQNGIIFLHKNERFISSFSTSWRVQTQRTI